MLKVETKNGMAPELYNEVQRLIGEWNGSDAAEQGAALPELVERIVKLKQADARPIARLASHDVAEAA